MLTITYCHHELHLSPFPERKTILVSGSKRGTRMPEDTSRERRCSGLDSFLEVGTRMIRKRKAVKKIQH